VRSVSPAGECYLRPNPYDNVVNTEGYIEIIPINPAYLYVPVYTPAVVFAPPRPGIVVGLSIHFAPSIFIGPAFVPFGWASRALLGVRTPLSSAEFPGAAPGPIEPPMFTLCQCLPARARSSCRRSSRGGVSSPGRTSSLGSGRNHSLVALFGDDLNTECLMP